MKDKKSPVQSQQPWQEVNSKHGGLKRFFAFPLFRLEFHLLFDTLPSRNDAFHSSERPFTELNYQPYAGLTEDGVIFRHIILFVGFFYAQPNSEDSWQCIQSHKLFKLYPVLSFAFELVVPKQQKSVIIQISNTPLA